MTSLPSADGQFWDIQDTSPWAQDSGGIATGGRANPFNGFGYLKLQVRGPTRAARRNLYLQRLRPGPRRRERFDAITPVLHDGVVVARAIFAPKDTDYLRYFDSFTNTDDEPRTSGRVGRRDRRLRGWRPGGGGGDLERRSPDRPGRQFVTVMQNARNVADPMRGPSGHGPRRTCSATARRAHRRRRHVRAIRFADPYPGYDPAHIGYVFTLTLAPGQTAALMTFVVKGLSEVYDPRGGYPIRRRATRCSRRGPRRSTTGADAKIPAPGSEIARVTDDRAAAGVGSRTCAG